MNELVVVLTRERETKNTIRFAEQENEEGLPLAIGTLYIQKHALKRLGNPDKIEVVVRATP